MSVTSDVQSVKICRVEGTNYYVIQCSYVEGSDARGCVYSIMGGVGAIARSNSEGVTVELADVICYNEVLVYDWENDGSIGTLPAPLDSTSTITINALVSSLQPMPPLVSS